MSLPKPLSKSSSHSNLMTLQQLIDRHINIASSSDDTSAHKAVEQNLANKLTALTHSAPVADIAFGQFCLDSRQLAEHDVFVLLKSQQPNCQKSRHYLYQAAENAAFILSEIDPIALLAPAHVQHDANIPFSNEYADETIADVDGVEASDIANSHSDAENLRSTLRCPVLYTPHIRDYLGGLIQAQLQYQQPVTLPSVVAVTGTNGKTTISQLVAQLTQLTGVSSAVMGTAGNGRLGALVQASHTTGDAVAVQQFLYQMGEEGAGILALEASSHGLDQQRLQGVPIKVAVYTNLSRDHLDYHADMAEYVAAKAKLFDREHFPSLTHAIINIDDEYAQTMLDTAHASDLTVWTYSLNPQSKATFVAETITPSLQGVEIALRSEFGNIDLISPLLGHFNVANVLAAIAATLALDCETNIERLGSLVPQLQGAVGRMQRVASGEGCFIVDYAHTPDALTQVLESLKTHCKGQLWAVFGCGGDRDAGKRPLMAQAGLASADQVILTADNPRTEDPNIILKNMQVGMSTEQYQRTHIEPKRQQAIEYAVKHAAADDIVVIAGKGHETYQEIDGVRYDFDDCVVLNQALQQVGRL